MPDTIEIEIPTYGKGMMGTASTRLSEECYNCVHLNRRMPLQCKVFPDRIPRELATGEVSHTKPFKGDNGILFEKLPGD